MTNDGEAVATGRSDCVEKLRLLSEYRTANDQYARAVALLTAIVHTGDSAEFLKSYDIAMARHRNADKALQAMVDHIRQHGC